MIFFVQQQLAPKVHEHYRDTALKEIRRNKTSYVNQRPMDGHTEANFFSDWIKLLDIVFTENDMQYLTIEQQRFLERYLNQGNIVDKKLIAKDANPYKNLDITLKEFDNFLGSYFGDDCVRFVDLSEADKTKFSNVYGSYPRKYM